LVGASARVAIDSSVGDGDESWDPIEMGAIERLEVVLEAEK